MKCLKASVPVVSGTTGWLDRWDEAVETCNKHRAGLFYASNYSIGVNIMFAINEQLAKIMHSFPEYSVRMEEIHHIHKLDAPSGTAISLADQIRKHHPEIEGWSLSEDDGSKIHIKAERKGEVTGFHSVIYDSGVDTITLSHNAKSRKGFASGAVMALEYMQGKTGIHSMKQLLNL